MKYLIGIDIGTQGTKANLFDTDGNNVMESFVSSNLIHLKDGGIEQDSDDILDSVVSCIRKVMSASEVNPEEVLAIGMDGQMAGILGIDKDFNPVGNYDSWLDTRCEPYIQEMKATMEDAIIRSSGGPVSYFHGPKILWRKGERPEEYNRIEKFIMITTYCVGKMVDLSADKAYIDNTHLHFTGFADTKNKTWNQELMDHFNVDPNKLPEIIEPYRVMGHLTSEWAEKCGLTTKVQVVAGCGDTAATALGAGVTAAGKALDVAGTASVFSFCVDEFMPDTEYKTLLTMPSIIDGLYTNLAYIGGGGQCIAWFKNNVVKELGVTFDQLNEEAIANEEADDDRLLFIPHFAGRTCPNNPNIRGSWLHMNWSHNRGHLYKSIMESIAYEYHHYMSIVKKSLPDAPLNTVIGVGGGAKSPMFNQIKSDVLGADYVPMERKDAATLACAVMAGYGIGLYDDIAETINRFVKEGDSVTPNPEKKKRYSKMAARYIKVLEQLEDIYR